MGHPAKEPHGYLLLTFPAAAFPLACARKSSAVLVLFPVSAVSVVFCLNPLPLLPGRVRLPPRLTAWPTASLTAATCEQGYRGKRSQPKQKLSSKHFLSAAGEIHSGEDFGFWGRKKTFAKWPILSVVTH